LKIKVSVKSNIKEFTKGMNKKQREQVPFALQQTFKSAVFDLRKHFIEKTFPNAFKTGNSSNFAKGILRMNLKHAKKMNFKTGTARASVFDSTNKDYLLMQERGGMKHAREGNYIAVPTPEQHKKLGKRRKAAQRPQQVLQKKNVRTIRVEKGKSHEAIVQGRRNKSKRLFHLVPSVPVRPILGFVKDGRRMTDKFMQRHFTRHFRNAMRSAK